MEDTDANSPTPEDQPTSPEAAPDVSPAPVEPADTPTADLIETVPVTEFRGGTPEQPSPGDPVSDTPPAEENDPLAPLLAKAATQRLSVPEEEKATALMRGRLLGKKDIFISAVGLLPK